MLLVGRFCFNALFRRQASSVEKAVPIPQQIRFAAHKIVGPDLTDVFEQNEAIAGYDQFVDGRFRVPLVADVPDNRSHLAAHVLESFGVQLLFPGWHSASSSLYELRAHSGNTQAEGIAARRSAGAGVGTHRRFVGF